MKIPGLGDVLEEGDGTRWRVVGVHLHDGVDEDRPEIKTLYIDVEPVKERPPVPDAFRQAVDS